MLTNLNNIKKIAKKEIERFDEHYNGVAEIVKIDGNLATIKLLGRSSNINHCRIVGNPEDLAVGQLVAISWEDQQGTKRPVVTGVSVSSGGANQGSGSGVVVDNITIEYSDYGLRVKPGGIGLGHLDFVPALADHEHDVTEWFGGWDVTDDGILFNNLTQITPDGAIILGQSPDLVILDSQDTTYRIWAGDIDPALSDFTVSKTGEIHAVSGDIASWNLNSDYLDADSGNVAISAATNPFIGLGGATSYGEAGIWMGKDSGVYKMYVGNPAGDYWYWDGSTLAITGDFQSDNFISGISGWRIRRTGDAEFQNVQVRGSLKASVFEYGDIQATAGTLLITRSASKLYADWTSPSVVGNSNTMDVDDDTSGTWLFAVNDILRMKTLTPTGVAQVWLKVTARSAQSGFTRYTVQLQNGDTSTAFKAGTGISDYGQSGDGIISLSSDQAIGDTPNINLATHAGTPWTTTINYVRVGNLDGVLGLTGNEYGIAYGEDMSDTALPYAIFSDQQSKIVGMAQEWWADSYTQRGEIDPSASGAETMFWLGKSSNDQRVRVSASGLVELNNIAIGSNIGPTFDGGILWIPPIGNKYDSAPRMISELDYTSPSVLSGVDAGWGKYNCGFRTGGVETNEIFNPYFGVDWNTGWDQSGDGTISRASGYGQKRRGNSGLKIVAGTGSTYAVTEAADAFSLPNGTTVWAMVWCKVASGGATGSGRVRIWDQTNSLTRDTVDTTTTNSWELLQATWTNNTGSPVDIRVRLINTQTDSSTIVWFDEVMAHKGAYPSMYSDGDLPTGTWSGTANDSSSTKVGSSIEYAIDTPTNFSISFWWMPYSTAGNMTYNAYLFDWYGSANDYIRLYQDYSTARYKLLWNFNGTGANSSTSADVSIGTFHHIAITWDGTDLNWYLDNSLVQSIQPSVTSFGTTPNQIAIGSDNAQSSRAEGIFSDFFILNYALTSTDVTTIYNASGQPAVLGTFSLKVYNEDAGATIINEYGLFVQDTQNALAVSTAKDSIDIGGFAINSGDIVIGDNQTGSAAIFWDASTGKFGFYGDGGSTPEVEIDTDGILSAGAGTVKIGAGGIKIYDTSGTTGPITWFYDDSGTYRNLGKAYGDYAGGTATDGITWLIANRDSNSPWDNSGVILAAVDDENSLDARLWIDTSGPYATFSGISYLDVNLDTGSDSVQMRLRNSDVAHGMTSIALTDTFLQINKHNSTLGGVNFAGFSEGGQAVSITGNATSDLTGKSTSAAANIQFVAWKKSGTGIDYHGSNANIAAFLDGGLTRFILDVDGDSHQDVGTAWTNFDEYDDPTLLTSLSIEVSNENDPIKDEFRDFIGYNRGALEKAKLVTFNEDGHHFVNMSKLTMLHTGAIRQLSQRQRELEKQIELYEHKLLEAGLL